MKKQVALISFIYLSWNVCLDGSKDYSGKHEDKYGVMHSTITLPTVTMDNTNFLTSRGWEHCYEKHRSFENRASFKEFLRHMPPEVKSRPDFIDIPDDDK